MSLDAKIFADVPAISERAYLLRMIRQMTGVNPESRYWRFHARGRKRRERFAEAVSMLAPGGFTVLLAREMWEFSQRLAAQMQALLLEGPKIPYTQAGVGIIEAELRAAVAARGPE